MRTAWVVQIEEHEAESTRAQHVLGCLQSFSEIERAHPEQSTDVDSGKVGVSRIEGVWKIDTRREITSGGDGGSDGIGQRRSPRGSSPHQLRHGTSRESSREQSIEIDQAGRDFRKTSPCLKTPEKTGGAAQDLRDA